MLSCLRNEGNFNHNYVIKLDQPDPTADKPQSKLWYQNDTWWALLPRSGGPSLWQRTNKGWIEHTGIHDSLAGLPGRADVWAEDNRVTAVGVGKSSLSVYRLNSDKNADRITFRTKKLAELLPPSSETPIETATITRDPAGIWWVAATADKRVCVWSSASDGTQWSSAYVLAEGINEDDICVITPVPRGVGVIWSDQVTQSVKMRCHPTGFPIEKWDPDEIIDIGNKSADDHLHTSLDHKGTLWVATKNSLDKIGGPQLILRIRSKDGKWTNKNMSLLENTSYPTRPIVIATGDSSTVVAGYSDNLPGHSRIFFGIVDTTLKVVIKNLKVVIPTDTINKGFINNVTGPRHPYPLNAPWIVLASDQDGRVYEADLKKMIKTKM